MSLGSIWLRFQQKYGKGLAVARARDGLRPRILETRPWQTDVSGPIECHLLTSKGDWLNAIWSLKSFFFYTKRRYPVCIHEDGSLPETARQAFREHFPSARLILRTEADAAISSRLKGFPQCEAFRDRHPLAIKVFDFSHFLNADRMFLFDSDLVFFDFPTDLINRLEDPDYKMNSVNADIATAYNTTPALVENRFRHRLIERFNSGLGLIHKASMDWQWFEEYLSLPGIFEHHWRTEQTLYALASSRFGCDLLPNAYDVYRGARDKAKPVRHYVGEIRHLMYAEGMATLAKRGFLHYF